MFSDFFLKSFRILLFPFSLIYWGIIAFRNWMYNKNLLRSASFGLPVICVGNLSTGGTGKSPMVEYILGFMHQRYKVATLSRGYKRKTKGYALATPATTALEIGDEPMLFHLKFPDVPVAVGEERIEAIPQLLHDEPKTEVIVLDDAFQHRAIKAGLNILLTDYHNLYTRDFYLPTGDLRDQKKSSQRADIIIVTKCRKEMTAEEKQKLIHELQPLPSQQVFFTSIEYGRVYHIVTREAYEIGAHTDILLVTGIANPRPLQKMLEEHSNSYHMLSYPDHHIFTIDDLNEIRKKFGSMQAADKIILTTEKDAVRLSKFNTGIAELPMYVIPVQHYFLFDDAAKFEQLLTTFVQDFRRAS